MFYSINKLATLAGVSVRTLHYYDEIGLLKPHHIEENGYRSYGEKELLLLQQILFFRELEFPLDEIKRIILSPYFDMETALSEQKKMLMLKTKRLQALIHTIDKTIHTMNTNQKIQDDELYDAFKDDDVKQYQEEVKQRWGNSDAYKQSMKKVGKMTKQEMEKLKADGKAHTQAIADAMDLGVDSPQVQALIKKSHEGINFFYDCSYEMFRNLGNMYVEDPRFTAYYENFRPGLARFVKEAIDLYCSKNSLT